MVRILSVDVGEAALDLQTRQYHTGHYELVAFAQVIGTIVELLAADRIEAKGFGDVGLLGLEHRGRDVQLAV
ncbi:hypothetical protein D3C84_1064960 [compost metagenome]